MTAANGSRYAVTDTAALAADTPYAGAQLGQHRHGDPAAERTEERAGVEPGAGQPVLRRGRTAGRRAQLPGPPVPRRRR